MPSSIGPYAAPAGSAGASVPVPNGGTLPGLGNFYLNQLPEAGFWNYLQSQGLTGNDPTARYAQGQQQRAYSGYLGQAAQNPNLGFFDYLSGQKPDFSADYNAQSPTQRFDFTSQTLAPRARWTFK